MEPLYKTTIVIWTDFNPYRLELDDLAREAVSGDGYCSKQEITLVEDPSKDPDCPAMEFFGNLCIYCGSVNCDPDNDNGCDEAMARGFNNDHEVGGEG